MIESKNVEIPETGRASVEFFSLEVPYGRNKGAVKVDGGDSLAADDTFYFSVERADPRHALLVHNRFPSVDQPGTVRPRERTPGLSSCAPSKHYGRPAGKEQPGSTRAAALGQGEGAVLAVRIGGEEPVEERAGEMVWHLLAYEELFPDVETAEAALAEPAGA